MHDTTTINGTERKQVYCLVRVYDLLKEKVGVRVFIDPPRFSGSELQFESKGWRVKQPVV